MYPRFLMKSCVAAGMLAVGLSLVPGCESAKKNTTPVLEDVPFEVETWQYTGHPGRRITSAHYEIYTTLTDRILLDALPQVVESAYRYYRELVPTAREPRQPMKVYLFARRGEWANFTRRFGPLRAQTLLKVRQGGYMERGITVAEYVSNAVTFPLLTHEGFHQFLYHCANPRVPAWLNEGLAVVCEGQRWDKTGLVEFDPWHNPRRRNTLAEALMRGEVFSLDELLRINAGNVVGGSTRRISAYYGQVWALMLFLREGVEGKYAARFASLRAILGNRELASAAGGSSRVLSHKLFTEYISDDLPTVQREYTEFMRQRILGKTEPKR